jgi:hypothetical protein
MKCVRGSSVNIQEIVMNHLVNVEKLNIDAQSSTSAMNGRRIDGRPIRSFQNFQAY